MTSIKTKVAALIGATAMASGIAVMAPTAAQAATTCQGGSSSGHCVETTNHVASEVLLDTLVLRNGTGSAGTYTCSFGNSASFSLTTTVSVEASVSASIATAVQGSVSAGVSTSVSISGSASASAGGTHTLQPGEQLVCERRAAIYSANVREYDYSGTGTTTTRQYSAQVPASIVLATHN